jgi:ureidoglycolate hydrolase
MLRKLALQPLDATTAAPFGKLITADPLASSPAADARDLDFQCDGRAKLVLMRYPFKPLKCSVFERHHHVGQGHLILEGNAAVTIVAPATPGRDRPGADDVVALLLNPGTGILLHRGVWHALERLAIAPPCAMGLLLTESETASDNAERGPGQRPVRSDVVDLKALEGIEFEVELG